MTHLAVAAADAPAPAGPPTAAALAARIQIPRRLPIRHDGEPLRHLSHSSYTRFLLCPEDWRRHYLKGERFPATGPMFLGGSVDAALTAYYQRILDHHDVLTLGQVKRPLPRALARTARRGPRRLGRRARPSRAPSSSASTRSS